MPLGTNLNMLKIIVEGLGDLAKDVVFVGGVIVELYVDDISQVAEVRQTDDVDCIVEIAGRWAFTEFEEKLRRQKFENDQKVICRWHYKNITVDIMPTDESILGFSNQWYSDGIVNSIAYQIDETVSIQILSKPYFIACKLEALFNRGMDDLRVSKDFEDIVFILNYSTAVSNEVNNTSVKLKSFIKESCKRLLENPALTEAIFCVLPYGENDPDYVKAIIHQLENLQKDIKSG